jgi:hypothetical protein
MTLEGKITDRDDAFRQENKDQKEEKRRLSAVSRSGILTEQSRPFHGFDS